MKGYLTTCDGAQFELPTLLKWEFSYTGSVPCDSFTLRCAYEPAMAETLRRAVRFTAREDGTVEFAGVVDECGVTCDEKGLQLEVSGRGMAALLLDNEAESVSYQWATMEEILKNHVTPYGIVCTGYDAVTAAARYRVANGSSQWKALNDFAALHGGIAPYFDKTGALEVKKNRKAARVSIDAKTPGNLLDRRALLHQGEQSQIDLIALLQVAVKFENHDQQIKSLKHRMDEQEEQGKSLSSLALSVQKLALSMESMIEEQKSQGERLAKLESEPGERWSGMTKTIFNTMVGAGSGALAVGIILLMAHYIK